MVAPGGNEVVGVKLSVMGTDGLNAMRSAVLMTNDTAIT
jgi:hypothetical protein